MRSTVLAAGVAAAVAAAVVMVMVNRRSPVLTPADVEKVTGLSNVRVVPPTGSPTDSKADLEFADQRGQSILRLNFISPDAFRQAKEQTEIEAGGRKIPAVLYNEPLPGVGDEAFDGPRGPKPTLVYFRKGNRAALMTVVQASRLRLTPEDLRALAKIAADRF